MPTFLELPIEIRHQIYSKISQSAAWRSQLSGSSFPLSYAEQARSCIEPWLPMSLLLVSRQVSREALDFAFKSATLAIVVSKLSDGPTREDSWGRLGRNTLDIMALHSHIKFITKIRLEIVMVPAQIIIKGPLIAHGKKHYYLMRSECWKRFSKLIRCMYGLQSVVIVVQCYSRRCMPSLGDNGQPGDRPSKLSCPHLSEQMRRLGGLVRSYASRPVDVVVHLDSFEPADSNRLVQPPGEIAARMRADKTMLYHRFDYVMVQIDPVRTEAVRVVNDCTQYPDIFSTKLKDEYAEYRGEVIMFDA